MREAVMEAARMYVACPLRFVLLTKTLAPQNIFSSMTINKEKEFELEMTWVVMSRTTFICLYRDDLLEEAKSRSKGGTRDIRVIRIIVCLNTISRKSFRTPETLCEGARH